MIVVVGLSHKSAPIEVRERLAVPADGLPGFLDELQSLPEVGEVMVLSTCNRVEIYATAKHGSDRDGTLAADAIEQKLIDRAGELRSEEVRTHLFRYTDDPAVRHVFRVAASLDSLVVGEPQILGQFKDAFEKASQARSVGMLLGRAVESALHVAKRVRTETQIGAGRVSISSAAIDLARQIFGDLSGRVTALLGAGEMAEDAAKVLCEDGAKLRVVNRSIERAQNVASMFKGEARPWTDLQRTLIEADVVIASTSSPHFVLTRELVASITRARRGRSLFIIDIAVPRDVDPQVNDLEGVYLYDIDDLEKIAADTMRGRLTEAQSAERIVDEEADAFSTWLEALKVTPTVVALRKHVQGVLFAELERSLGGKLKHLGPAERKALEAMVSAAVNKLTHAPSTRLKAAAAEGAASDYMDALRHLFDLPDNDEPAAADRPSRRDSQPRMSKPDGNGSSEAAAGEHASSDPSAGGNGSDSHADPEAEEPQTSGAVAREGASRESSGVPKEAS
ncbi:MAG: glutamyl-tRNA reductase [Deltaproteobacteria bacterium]|nr:glutamyl-tRNA reductase [Deltaproteobacteria bacterium]